MNVHTLGRVWLANQVALLDPRWTPTTVSVPDLNATLTAQIGHAAPSPDTYRGKRIPIPVTLWAIEANDTTAVESLYEAIAWDHASLVYRLDQLERIRQVTVDTVEARVDGPSWYLAADLTVTVRLTEES